MAAVIAILNSKGGTGKTTIATNVAGCLHRQHYRVVIVDADPQGSARDWHALQPDGVNLPPVVGIDRPVLHKNIPALANGYDYIVIDGAAKLADITASAVRTADFVLIPVRHSGFDMWAVESLVETIRARQLVAGGRPQAAFVISCQVQGTRLAQSVDAALLEWGLPVLHARTTRRVAYEEAGGLGLTVLDLAGRTKAAHEIEKLTRELIELLS